MHPYFTTLGAALARQMTPFAALTGDHDRAQPALPRAAVHLGGSGDAGPAGLLAASNGAADVGGGFHETGVPHD